MLRVGSEHELLRTTAYEVAQNEFHKVRLLEYLAVLKDICHGDGVGGQDLKRL